MKLWAFGCITQWFNVSSGQADDGRHLILLLAWLVWHWCFQSLVQDVDGDQLHNPFTEIQILSHHSNIVRQLIIIDHSR